MDRSPFVPILKALGPEMTLQWPKITRSAEVLKWPIIGPFIGRFGPLLNLTEIFTQTMYPPSLNKIGPKLFELLSGQACYGQKNNVFCQIPKMAPNRAILGPIGPIIELVRNIHPNIALI